MGAQTHRLFGRLFLEEPAEHLSISQVYSYRQLRPFINDLKRLQCKLSVRNASHGWLIQANRGGFDYEQEFQRFCREEVGLWCNRGIDRPKEELIQASGNLGTSRIAHHLHNPSFVTERVRDGFTADETSPCTALIIALGFDESSVMIDHTARRVYQAEPIRDYPSEILACYENYLATVRQNMVAPVEVIYGNHVQQRMNQLIRPTYLDLWGSYEGITLHLEREFPGAGNPQNQGRLLRFLIYAKHPQCFLSAWGKKWAIEQDRILSVAYRLACVTFTENLLQKRAWQQLINIKPHSHYAINEKFEKESLKAILEVQNQLSKSDDFNVAKKALRVKTLTKKLNPQIVESGTQCRMKVDSGPKSLEQDRNEMETQTLEISQKTSNKSRYTVSNWKSIPGAGLIFY